MLKLDEETQKAIIEIADSIWSYTKSVYEKDGHDFSPIMVAEIARREFLHGVKTAYKAIGIDETMDELDNEENIC